VAQMDDGQIGDNINRMKVYRFESCPDYKINNLNKQICYQIIIQN